MSPEQLAIPEGLKPLAVWDVKAADWRHRWTEGMTQQMAWWVQQHLTTYASDIYRIEFYLLDGPFAVVHKYALDDNEGFKYLDFSTGRAAVEPPVVVPLDELPPAHLLEV
jgi:purine nucleoside permease